jgi:hypothetical protein
VGGSAVPPEVVGTRTRRRSQPIEHSHDVDADYLVTSCETEQQLSVLVVGEPSIKARYRLDGLPSEEHDTDVGIAEVKARRMTTVHQWWRREQKPRERMEVLVRTLSDPVRKCEGPTCQCPQLGLHVSRQPDIIVIEKSYIGRLGQRESSVPVGGDVVVGDVDIRHAVPLSDLRGGVARVIIDDDNLLG